MIAKGMFGVLAGSTLLFLITISFDAYAAGFKMAGSSAGTLMMFGVGMVGLALWGKRKWGKPVNDDLAKADRDKPGEQ